MSEPDHTDACTCPICSGARHVLQEMVELDYADRVAVLEVCLLRAHAAQPHADGLFVLSGLAVSHARMVNYVSASLADSEDDEQE